MAYHLRLTRPPSKTAVLRALLVASAVMLMLPSDFLKPLRGMAQLIAIPQWAVREGTVQVRQQIQSLASESIPAEKHQEVLREKAALENELASLRQRLVDAESSIQELTGLRKRLPAQATLVPARVIGLDAAAGRDSLLVGDLKGLKARQGDWVASRVFLDAGTESGVRDQLAVLSRECLLGWVEQSSAFASRVVLLSDPLTRRPLHVRIGSRRKQAPLYTAFALEGAGQGRMLIPDVPADLIKGGRVAVGDVVTSDPSNPNLPVALVIGEIRELVRNRQKPLFYDALVAPLLEPASLSHVYVVRLGAQSD